MSGYGYGARPPRDGSDDAPAEHVEKRPVIERIGLAAIAAVLGALFAFVSVVSWVGGEAFLAFMGALGVAVTVWLVARTIVGR